MTYCSVVGCGAPAKKRGMCNRHYLRMWRHGSPLAGSTDKKAAQSFLDKALVYDGNECLIWPYSKNQHGYGQIRKYGKLHLVSRIVCEEENGPAPTPEHEAAHSCGNGHLACCTRKHMRWATRVENRQDMINHGRSNRGKRVKFNRLSDEQKRTVIALVGTIPDYALARKVGVTPSAIKHYRQENV